MCSAAAPHVPEAQAAAALHVQTSPSHSPVPYQLFYGLAAMLGLIAFALLVLVWSNRKVSGHHDNAGENNSSGDRDVEANADEKPPAAYEEKIVVIMAGQVNPTFLATPVSSGASSSLGNNFSGRETADGRTERRRERSGEEVQIWDMGSRETCKS